MPSAYEAAKAAQSAAVAGKVAAETGKSGAGPPTISPFKWRFSPLSGRSGTRGLPPCASWRPPPSPFVIVPEQVRHTVDDEEEDPLLLRTRPAPRLREAGRRGKEDIPRNAGGGPLCGVFLGKRNHVRRPRPPEELPVPPLHFPVSHHQDSQVRRGHPQEPEGPPDEGTQDLPAKGDRPRVLPDADPVPGRFPVHEIPLAGVPGYSTRGCETAESTRWNALPTAYRSRSVMSHSLSWPSR